MNGINEPAEVDTLATKVTRAKAIKNDVHVGRKPIMGYVIDVNIRGTIRNRGNSANVFPRKYVSVLYSRLLDSRKNMGNSAQNTLTVWSYNNSLDTIKVICLLR